MEDVLNSEVLLDSREAIKHNMTPFGRKLGVVSDNVYPFYHIVFTDNKPGALPTELAGKWTSLAYCEAALSAYLHQLWAFSDAKQKKPLITSNNAKTKIDKISADSQH